MPSSSATNIEHLYCYYQNVHRVNSKVLEFYSSVCEGEFDCVALCETRLRDEISSSQLFSGLYNVYRKDRKFNGVDTIKLKAENRE